MVKWKQLHPGAKLSHSTIYAALGDKRLSGCSEGKHLLRHGKRRFKSIGNTGVNPVRPDHRIREWPDEIRLRARFGDWEGDTVRGGLGKGFRLTRVGRMSRYLVLGSLPGKRSKEETGNAVCQALSGLPVWSPTVDNGAEFAGHRQIADPASPWQRGSNENMNGLLRFFFP